MQNRTVKKDCGGQVIAEYAVMAAIFVMISLALLFLLAAVTGHGWRVLSLLAWEPFM